MCLHFRPGRFDEADAGADARRHAQAQFHKLRLYEVGGARHAPPRPFQLSTLFVTHRRKFETRRRERKHQDDDDDAAVRVRRNSVSRPIKRPR